MIGLLAVAVGCAIIAHESRLAPHVPPPFSNSSTGSATNCSEKAADDDEGEGEEEEEDSDARIAAASVALLRACFPSRDLLCFLFLVAYSHIIILRLHFSARCECRRTASCFSCAASSCCCSAPSAFAERSSSPSASSPLYPHPIF